MYQFEILLFTVELAQPLARIGQTDAFPHPARAVDFRRILRPPANPVVGNLQKELAVIAGSADFNFPGPRVRLDGITDGIFNQRLQDQVGHGCIQGGRFHIQAHP